MAEKEHREQVAGSTDDAPTREIRGWPARRDRHLPGPFARRVMVAVGIGSLMVVAILLLWYVAHVLLLAFAGVLLGVLIWTLADLLKQAMHIAHGWAVAIVVVVLVLVVGGIIFVAGTKLIGQADELAHQLPQAVDHFADWLSQYGWAQELLDLRPADGVRLSPDGRPPHAPGTAPAATQSVVDKVVQATADPLGATATQAAWTVLGALISFIVVSVVAVYVAASPDSYVRGVLRLVPKPRRERAKEVLAAVGYTLRWWLIGQGITMLIIGTLTAVGLWIIGIRLWLLFGVLAALFNFIPNFGPLISFIPATLFASTEGVGKVIAVAVLYVIAQSFEGYVLTPLVQRKAVSLPPAILIVAQVLMGVLAGALGVMLAAPLTAALLVAVKMLYVEDTLGDKIDTPVDHMSSTNTIKS